MTEGGPVLPRLRALVLSDLHCTSEPPSDTSPSYWTTHPGRSGAVDPLSALEALLESEDIKTVDLVICPGDMVNKADPDALVHVWDRLNALAQSLQANLVATVGNHDMDSRGKFDVDPRAQLVELDPPFPVGDEAQKMHYWTYDFAILDRDRYRVVALNSCALHGYGQDAETEFLHGRFRRRVGEHLRKLLNGARSAELSILVVHHHIHQLPNVDIAEHSMMTDAQELVDVLSATGNWLVIHGHKHRAYAMFAAGGGNAPLVFSAGSFSARHYGDLQTRARNQVYLLEFAPPQELERLDLPVAAKVRSWTLDAITGWAPAANWPRDGLPATTGMGWHTNLYNLARKVGAWTRANGGVATLEDLINLDARWPYLSPPDLEKLAAFLGRETPPIEVVTSGTGIVQELVVRTPLDISPAQDTS